MAIKVYYAKLNNMGDLLNEYIIPRVTGREIVCCKNFAAFDVMGIGSYSGALWANCSDKPDKRVKDRMKQAVCTFLRKPCAVWGTGFFADYSKRPIRLVRHNVSFIAVRGALSQQMIEKALGQPIHPVLCDGGILSSAVLDSPQPKKYAIGFIPHYKEQTLCREKGIWSWYEDREDCTVVDLRDDPVRVIEKIAQCELIVSSSLHGCIVADSFHVPNMRVTVSGIPGSGFKFDDYYSAYGLTVPARPVERPDQLPTAREIRDSYRIDGAVIEQKKEDMARCLREFVAERGL